MPLTTVAPPSASTVVWTERTWRAMGSDVHLLAATADEQLVGLAIDELERLERCWSRFRADSELVALNDDPRHEVAVSPTLAGALHRAVLAWELTEGRFDPTVLDSLELAGYRDPFTDDGPARGSLASCHPAPTPARVRIDPERSVVRRPPGLRVDLGGIGKGLAADLVAQHLVQRGAVSVCLSVGGDVRVAGVAPVGGWRIPVLRPRPEGDRAAPVRFDATLHRGAIVTSTTTLRCWPTHDGDRAHHLIDPRSGRPSRSGVTTAVVVAQDAWWAEVLAKAALIAGPSDGRRLLDHHGAQGWFDVEVARDH